MHAEARAEPAAGALSYEYRSIKDRTRANRLKSGQAIESEQTQTGTGKAGGAQMAAGYGKFGASKTKSSMLGWVLSGGAPEDDSDLHGSTLRRRARDLDMGGGVARAAVSTETTTVIGTGLIPKPAIDYEALGMTEETAKEWEKIAKREFAFWANSKFCDAAEKKNFYQLQSLAFRSMLVSGDVVALMPVFESKGSPYTLHIKLLEADRLATPDSGGDSTSKASESGGSRIIDGVEVESATGRVIRYYFASRHPLSESDTTEITYEPVDAYGAETGMPNVLHVYVPDRPEQYRGVPMMAPVMEQVKQLERYLNAELTASLISSMFTLFITSDKDDNMRATALEDSVDEADRQEASENALHMRAGAIYELAPGQKPEGVSPTRNNTAFATFIDAVCTQIGASVEMPKEILLKAFTKSYSASRGALTEYWRKIPRARRDFIADFCQPVYEAFLAEAVALGRIDAPGFFDDPVIRACWCKCNWIGSTMQQLDPLKEVSAAEKRIALNLSTQEREAAEFNGSDWNENMAERRREVAAMAELAALGGTAAAQDGQQTPDPNEPPEGEETDDEDMQAETEDAGNEQT